MPTPQYTFAVAPPIRDGEALRVAFRKATVENATEPNGLSGVSNPATVGLAIEVEGGALSIVQRSESADAYTGLLPVARGYVRVRAGGGGVEYERLEGSGFTPLGARSSPSRVAGEVLAALASGGTLSVVIKPSRADEVLSVHVLEGEGQGRTTPAFEKVSTVDPLGVFPCEDGYVALYQAIDGAARSLRLKELRPDGSPSEPAVDVSLDAFPGESGLKQVSVACDTTRRSVMMLHTGRGVVEAYRDATTSTWKTELRDAGAPRFAHAVHAGTTYLLAEATETTMATFSAFGSSSFTRRAAMSMRLSGLSCAAKGCVATGRAGDEIGNGAYADVMALALPLDPGEGTATLSPSVVVLDRVGTAEPRARGCSAAGGDGTLAGASVAALGLVVAAVTRRRRAAKGR